VIRQGASAELPTIARWRGYRFSFYSREPDEPSHVHVVKGSGQAKFGLEDSSLAKSVGFATTSSRASQERWDRIATCC
jgi:Domain of unknown function (DUF4160)